MASHNLEIRQSSAALRGEATGLRSLPNVSKYIDTSTCIGCKACEVACQEWNDLKVVHTQQVGSYQTLRSLDADFWNLIKFNEREIDGNLAWLMRKDQCMHCSDPGCLRACPAPGAIVQYENGIVDVNPEQCIGCGLCETGCPFDVPRFSAKTGKMAKCTLCVDRVGQLTANGFANAGIYDPAGVGGTSVITVLAHGDHPEWYGLPPDPKVPASVRFARSILRPLGLIAIFAAIAGVFGHFIGFGPRRVGPPQEPGSAPKPPDKA